MAVLVHLTITPATRSQLDELDLLVIEHLTQAGGPPAGLMCHVAYPEGDGFVMADVWRNSAEGRAFTDDVLRPLLARLGLSADDGTERPVWSFARPS